MRPALPVRQLFARSWSSAPRAASLRSPRVGDRAHTHLVGVRLRSWLASGSIGQLRAATLERMRESLFAVIVLGVLAGCGNDERGEPWLSTHPDGTVRERGFVILTNEGPPVRVGEWRGWNPDGVLVLEGRYLLGKKEGQWFEMNAAGLAEEGSYVSGERVGRWISRDADGQVREHGLYMAGERVGPWTLLSDDGRSEEVLFAADGTTIRQGADGLRSVFDADGRKVIEGKMRDDKRDGEWVFWDAGGSIVERRVYSLGRELSIESATERTIFWPNGEMRESGPIRDGKRYGRWVVRSQLGEDLGSQDYESDLLVSSELNGILSRHNPDGYVESRGRIEFGKEEGLWEEYHASGQKKAEGVYRYGRKEDAWTYWHANGQESEKGSYLRGGRVGRWAAWHPNGQLHWEASYVAGQREGPSKVWHDNGQLSEQGQYLSGKRHGAWLEWHPSGQRAASGDYVEGLREGSWLFWRSEFSIATQEYDGLLKRGRFEAGKEEGTWTFWQENGHREKEGEFRQGLMEGKWVFWSTTGRIARIASYRRGVLVER